MTTEEYKSLIAQKRKAVELSKNHTKRLEDELIELHREMEASCEHKWENAVFFNVCAACGTIDDPWTG